MPLSFFFPLVPQVVALGFVSLNRPKSNLVTSNKTCNDSNVKTSREKNEEKEKRKAKNSRKKKKKMKMEKVTEKKKW